MIPMINSSLLGGLRQNTQLQQRKQVEAQRDARFRAQLQEVIDHENAHAAAAGELGGAPVILADHQAKVVFGGYVPIKMQFGKTAEDALRFASRIARAALAPANPSAPDRAIAFSALEKGSRLFQERKAREAVLRRQAEKTNPSRHPGLSRHYWA